MRVRLMLAVVGTALCLPSLLHPQLVAQAPEPAVQGLPESSADDATAKQENRWMKSIEALLVAEKFDDLDRMADQYRREKTKLPGGEWRLRYFYSALDAPQLTDKDSVDHLEHLRKWMAARPESITARVALATSLTRWAWVARGGGLANTVTAEGWRLFELRAKEAQTVLQGSADMHVLCPQWFSQAMKVGLALGWDGPKMEAIYDKAVQFEPTYPYFYRERANYLLPKWYGEGSDATSFAKKAADRARGDEGDVIYFVIASEIIHRGNGNLTPFAKAMDWQRIQRGYKAQIAQAGTSHKLENQMAFMAYHYKDTPVAQQQFALIGNEWARGVWKDKTLFDRARDWSTGRTSWP